MAASGEISGLLETFLKTEDCGIAKKCVKDIENGHIKIVDFVAAMGTPLTSKDTQQRRRSMKLLVDVVSDLPPTILCEKEVVLLAEFLCSRLVDHHSIAPICLAGIDSLIKFNLLNGSDIINLLRSLFRDITVQTLVQADRFLVYNLLEWVLNNRMSDVKSLGSEFIIGVIQCVDSERDPRNLLIVFNLVKTIALNLTLANVVEELFEVVSCYYPVDFSPPPSSGVDITKEQLVIALNDVITATPEFAPFCLPLLLEKLGSSLVDAKIDSLRTLCRCCDVYRMESFDDFASAFWNLIKSEVFAQRAQTEQLALSSLTSITKCLSCVDGLDQKYRRLDAFIQTLFDDCVKYLHESPEKSVFIQSGKLLTAACIASYPASCAVVKLAFPALLSEFHLRLQVNDRQGLLSVCLSLIKATAIQTCAPGEISPLAEFKDVLLATNVSLLANINSIIRCRGVAGLAGLVATPSLLNNDEMLLVARHLLVLYLADGDVNVRQECLLALTYMASERTAAFQSVVLPVFVNLFSKMPPADDITLGPHVNGVFLLDSLASLSVEPSICGVTVPAILGDIDQLMLQENDPTTQGELLCACSSLKSIVTASVNNTSIQYFMTWLVPRCIATVIRTCSRVASLNCSDKVVAIQQLVAAIRLTVQKANEQDLVKLASEVTAMFLHGDNGYIQSSCDGPLPSVQPLESEFYVFMYQSFEQECGVFFVQKNSPSEHLHLIDILSAVVCSLPLRMTVPCCEDLLTRLKDISFHHPSLTVAETAAKCLAGIVNKASNDTFLHDLLAGILATTSGFLSSSAFDDMQRAMKITVWLTKALVLKNHPMQAEFAQQLVLCLSLDVLAFSAAEGFQVILSEEDETNILTSASHANITSLYRQRFFTIVLPKLLTCHQASANDKRHVYVRSLTYVMQSVPKQVYMSEIHQLLPVLMQSVMSKESSMWLPAMETLTDLLRNNPDVMHSYVDDLIIRMMSLCDVKENLANSAEQYQYDCMKVRCAAIQCLSELSKMPTHLIMRHQSAVLRQLGLKLDDHKRLVRQEAAQARTLWYFVGAADEHT